MALPMTFLILSWFELWSEVLPEIRKPHACMIIYIYDQKGYAGKYNCDVNDIVFIMVLQYYAIFLPVIIFFLKTNDQLTKIITHFKYYINGKGI